MRIGEYVNEPAFRFGTMRAESGMRRWLQRRSVLCVQEGREAFRNAEAYHTLKLARSSMCAYDEKIENYIIRWDNEFEINLDETNALRFIFLYRLKTVFCHVATAPVVKSNSLLLRQLMGGCSNCGTIQMGKG
jgi:hypothetical protein